MSNDAVAMCRYHNLDIGEDEASRGVRKQKYPLDDYLINPNAKTSLLSPISPVSSPETVDVLRSAERLVKDAQKQIMEVSFNSALNTLDENPSNYTAQQPMDERLMYVREIVDSKFQESNDPNGVYIRKASSSSAPNSNKKLQHDQFPVKGSNGMLYKSLEISAQNSESSTTRMASGMLSQSEKPFFKKAPNWFRIESPRRIDVFPTLTASNLKSRSKNSIKVPHCTMTNNGVIEINGTDHPTGTIQVQTGPTVDIRRGLTIQTIENVHISPDPFAVPIYNNIATYCFQHEPSPSSSLVESKRSHVNKRSNTSSVARNVVDSRKERQIQSTDRNNIHIADSNNPICDTNQDTIRTHNSNSNSKHYPVTDHNEGDSITNLQKLSIGDEDLHRKEITRGTVDDVKDSSHSSKAVIINTTPGRTSVYEEFSVTDAEVETEVKHGEISSNIEVSSSYRGQKFHHVRSDNDYVPRSQIRGTESGVGSCTKKCERDVEYREKGKLSEALETIDNIKKIRFDTKDTGIVPAKSTHISGDKKHCLADAVDLEFGPLSEPEHFKTALENLCKSSQNTEASKVNTDSEIFQGAINDFVQIFFDQTSQSTVQNLENEDLTATENKQPMEADVMVDKLQIQPKNEKATKTPKQVKLIQDPEKMEHCRRSSERVNLKINNAAVNDLSTMRRNSSSSPTFQARTGEPKESNKYPKLLVPQRSQLPKGIATQIEKGPSGMISNEEKTRLENLDLKEPCVSDVDTVLKVYRESMAAICLGTDQLSQLISRHITKNAVATADQISSLPFPNSTLISGNTAAEPCDARSENNSVKPVLNLDSYGSSKIQRHLFTVHQKDSTEQNPTQITCSNQIQAVGTTEPIFEQDRISRRGDYPRISRDDAAFSNENNSVCINESPLSTANECSLICGKSLSEQKKTLSNSNKKSSLVQFNIETDASNAIVTPKELQQSPLNITQSSPTVQGVAKGVCKTERNRFTNIQYRVAEPLEGMIPIVVTLDEKNSTPQSALKNPLTTYLDLENACGRDMRSHRRSNYDIHNDQTEDFNLYKYPVLISGHRDNLDASSNDCNDESTAGDNVVQRREIELQIFGQILDGVKNSSQFLKRSIISLFNGMKIDSVSDIVRNLKDAEVHPIIIEKFLLILKERNREQALFGENLMLSNPEPVLNDWQKNYKDPTDLVKTKDNMNSFKHSTHGFNGSIKTTNIQISEGDKDLVARQTADTQITKTLDTAKLEMNVNLKFNKDYNLNGQHDEGLKNNLPNEPVEFKVNPKKQITEGDLENCNYDNLGISKTIFEEKTDLQSEALRKPQQKYEGGRAIETQGNVVGLKGKDAKGWSKDSISIETASKNNDSESNTDKDISFQILHDADVNNEVLDLSSVQNLSSVTLKNGNSGEIVELQIKRKSRNSFQLNSLAHEQSSKVNSNSGARKSSPTSDKSNGKLKSSSFSAPHHASSTENLQPDDRNVVCHCRISRDHKDSNTGPQCIPCQSSLDAVNAIIDLQIQNDYKRLGLLDPEEKVGLSSPIPDKMTTANEGMPIRRSRPLKSGATPKSHVRKATDPGNSGIKKMKQLIKKVSGNRESPRDNKQGVGNTESSDLEKFVQKHFCALCMRLQGKCSCLDCANCRTYSRRSKKASAKPKNEREKPINNVSTARQSRSPKRPGHTAGESPMQKKSRPTSKGLLSQSTALPLACKSKDCSDGIVKNNGAKKKKGNDEESQNVAPNSNNLQVEDKSQNTAKTADITTICKSTATSGRITACKSEETSCRRLILLDKACSIVPKKLDKTSEINTVYKPQVKEAGTLKCFENCLSSQDLSTDLKNNYPVRMNTTREKITRCTEARDFSTMGSQTSENCNDFHRHQTTSTKNIPETGTVAVSKTACQNIFAEESIVVLQPLNEFDHTFFIAKPNCAERQIIQEKLNLNFNINAKKITTQPSAYKFDQRDKQSSKDAIQLHNATSAMSSVKSKECQAGCSGGTVMENSSGILQSTISFGPLHETHPFNSFLENQDECPDLCTNEEDCLGICPQSPTNSDSRFNCKQDCSNEETCRELCASLPQVELSLQTRSINIDGIVENLNNFIAENYVPSDKLRIVKHFLQEMKNIQDSMSTEKEKLAAIDEISESWSNREMIIAGKPVGETKPICGPEGHRKSVQYDEPHEKVQQMMENRKSLILHNVVRSVADMHPSTNLERLRLRTRDPLVSGNFNKPESDQRYSFFNKSEPGGKSIDLNDPRIKAHLESVAEAARMQRRENTSPDHSIDSGQMNPKTATKKLPAVGKPNNKNAAKLNKSRRGMDADSRLSDPLNKTSVGHDITSMKSFESSDLEPGEFLQVRTPFDDPKKSRQSRVKIDLEIGKLSQDEIKCNGPCNNYENYLLSARNTSETMNIENKYEVCRDSDKTIATRKKNRDDNDKIVRNKAETVSPYTEESLVKTDAEIGVLSYDKAKNLGHKTTKDSQFKNESTRSLRNKEDPKTDNSAGISKSNSTDLKLNSIEVTERNTATNYSALLNMNNNHGSVTKDSHGITNQNQVAKNLQKHSNSLGNRTENCNRPQIIDHFLGKRRLEDIRIEDTDDKTGRMFKEYGSLGDENWQQLYMKSDFTSKTTRDLENSDIMEGVAPSRSHNKKNLGNCIETSIRRWDQTSSDTYSEGEINLPSSCSYSVGEIKLSTPSSATAGRSFQDPDGFTIFVTKSVFDSTYATCTSPGEILAHVQRAVTDSSSSLS